MRELEGKVALVTGGSRGIGRAICVGLAKAGAKVFVNFSSNSNAADETVALCKAAGGNAEVLGFDVGSSDAVSAAIETIIGSAGRLDILVNNAGIAKDGLLMRYKDEDWEKVLSTNLTGAFYCCRAAVKSMMKSRFGRIINISSVVGEMGNPGQAAYVASKAGLIGMTKSMARELASRNITVNAVAPGYIETDMTGKLDEKMREELLKAVPLGRIGAAQDIADAVLFLASDRSAYITGQTLSVNGGMYM